VTGGDHDLGKSCEQSLRSPLMVGVDVWRDRCPDAVLRAGETARAPEAVMAGRIRRVKADADRINGFRQFLGAARQMPAVGGDRDHCVAIGGNPLGQCGQLSQ
jgi:hypothetical protein